MVTSEQVMAARALLRWSERDLAQASKLPPPTVERLEATPGPLAAGPDEIAALSAAFAAAGVEFIDEDGFAAGVLLRKANTPSIPVEELNASNDE